MKWLFAARLRLLTALLGLTYSASALTASDSRRYPLLVLCDRPAMRADVRDTLPDTTWCRDENGVTDVGSDVPHWLTQMILPPRGTLIMVRGP